jgi:hypothetical protein
LRNEVIGRLPGFSKRLHWFLENRKELARHISHLTTLDETVQTHWLLAVPTRDQLERVLGHLFDENEFLSPFGIRSLSKIHREQPFVLPVDGRDHRVEYAPGESGAELFGGNSNWRGPIWFPVNFLLIEALERYHHFYGEGLRFECPARSGQWLNLKQIARELAARLTRLFLPGTNGRRPCFGDEPRFARDPHWRELLLFHEYFHGDSGRGLGAEHQTGWTALVAQLLEDLGKISA